MTFVQCSLATAAKEESRISHCKLKKLQISSDIKHVLADRLHLGV